MPSFQGGQQDTWKKLHRVADNARDDFRQGMLNLFSQMQREVKFNALRDALKTGNISAAWRAIPWEDVINMEATDKVRELLGDIFKKASAATMAGLMNAPGVEFKSIDESTSQYWAEIEGSQLVTHITEQTRKAIQQAVTDAFRYGTGTQPQNRPIFTILEQAANIRDSLGLNARQVAALDNYRWKLRQRGVMGPAYDAAVERFRWHQLRARADMIARTETIQAASEGQRALWDYAIGAGTIDPAYWQVMWVVTPDDVTCERCLKMSNQRREFDGLYLAPMLPSKVIKGPTLHPNCRCTEVVVPRKGRPRKKITTTRTSRVHKEQAKITPPPITVSLTPATSAGGTKFEWEQDAIKEYPELYSVIGPVSRVDDFDLDVIRTQLRHLDLVPKKMMKSLVDRGQRWAIKNAGVPEIDDQGMLRGVQPRGYAAGETWDEAAGCYSSDGWIIVGNKPHGSTSVALHETGHAVGQNFGFKTKGKVETAEHSDEWREIHKRNYDKLRSYYKQEGPGGRAGMQEYFAETFAEYIKTGYSQVKAEYGEEVANYMKKVVEKAKTIDKLWRSK